MSCAGRDAGRLAAGLVVAVLVVGATSGGAFAKSNRNATIRPGYAQTTCLANNSATGKVSTARCNGKQNQAWLVSGAGNRNATIRLGYAQANCLTSDNNGLVHVASCAGKQKQAWLISGIGLRNATIRPGYAQKKCLTNDQKTGLVYLAPCDNKQHQAWLVAK